eukprot:TRINITY_DN2333_c0_g1_i1.p1 TRINITY_DN2333_c0_g1~~TRINITY_DN2333_c0_g1_i1.p1  ORF type:complete len:453 (-),score=43.80 TRINITY_DN2333_c0_g1_i1:178-1536(-)
MAHNRSLNSTVESTPAHSPSPSPNLWKDKGDSLNVVKRVTIDTWQPGQTLLNSPRSKLTLTKMGFLEHELSPKKVEDFKARGFSQADAEVKQKWHEKKRVENLQLIRTEYQKLCQDSLTNAQTVKEQLAAELSTVVKRRDERNAAMLKKKQLTTAKKILQELQLEEEANARKAHRDQVEQEHADRMQRRLEEQKQRNEKKRIAAEARMQATLDQEQRIIDMKKAKFEDKQERLREAREKMEELQQKQLENQRLTNQLKQQERENRKAKAERDEAERKARSLDKMAVQEENLRRILGERDRRRREKALLLQSRNDEVMEAVERQYRKTQYMRDEYYKKAKEKADKVEWIKHHRDDFVTQSRHITQTDANTRQRITDWIEKIRVTGSYEVPEWLDINLSQYKSVFEAELKNHPPHRVEKVMAIINQPKNFKKHAVPLIQSKQKQYWAKWMYNND